jgi:hypothetical protein
MTGPAGAVTVGPGVFVPADVAGELAGLALRSIEDAARRGQGRPRRAVEDTVAELVRAARAFPIQFRSGTDSRQARTDSPTLVLVPTSTAAARLGITQRAVLARVKRKTLHAELDGGRWLIALPATDIEENTCA